MKHRRFALFGVNPGVLGAFIVLMVLLFATESLMRDTIALQSLAQQVAVNTIIAVGMTFVIITAGIDLSVGSIQGFVGVITAMTLMSPNVVARFGHNAVLIACAVGLVGGILCGFISGAAVAWLRMQPFIVTLAMMWIVRSAASLMTDGVPIGVVDPSLPHGALRNEILQKEFTWIAMGYAGPIPIAALIALIVVVLGHILLTKTVFGRHVFALGGNAEAARLSGVNVANIRVWVYTISGVLSAIAAIIVMSRLNSGQPTVGAGYELYAIAAVVVGGTSLFGGSGSVVGSAIGAIIIGAINMWLDLHQISSFWQPMITGGIIFTAVLLDEIVRRRSG